MCDPALRRQLTNVAVAQAHQHVAARARPVGAHLPCSSVYTPSRIKKHLPNRFLQVWSVMATQEAAPAYAAEPSGRARGLTESEAETLQRGKPLRRRRQA